MGNTVNFKELNQLQKGYSVVKSGDRNTSGVDSTP